ncbi:MAG: hypothetical protein RIA08_20585 [Roseovarius sp.]|uniref:hypothetical protein n=1 Tax=Roseovarius sp. TaxID=1486281 RepID=UPI0032ECA77B
MRATGLAALLALMLAQGGTAQEAVPAPGRSETARLVWSTLIAVDHANRTGNYAVLRDLGAPDFRNANDPAKLAAIFASVRKRDLGLERVVLSNPVYTEEPGLTETGLFEVKGSFPARPEGVSFELYFQHVEGAWKLYGLGIFALEAEAEAEAGE